MDLGARVLQPLQGRRTGRAARIWLALGAVGLLASGALQVLAGTPASAAALGCVLGASPTPSVALSSPAPGAVSVLTTSSPLISGTAVPGGQGCKAVISAIRVVISSTAGAPGTSFELTPQAPAAGSTWSFSGVPPTPLAYNGRYSVTVTATETDTGLLGGTTTGTASTSAGLAEEVSPVAPQNVVAAQSGPHQVTVSWSPNPEPDIEGYELLRATDGAPAVQLGFLTGTSYTDSTAVAGSRYTYSVEADRAGSSPGQHLLSPPASTGSLQVSGASSPTGSTAPATTKSGRANAGTIKAGPGVTAGAKSGSGGARAGSIAGSGGSGAAPGPLSAPLLTQSQLAAQYAADIVAAGKAKAPTPTTASPASGSSDASQIGAPTPGGFSDVLPYPKGKAPAGSPGASAPPVTRSGGSRARMLATVALGMIVLVVAALAIRLALRVRRP